MMATEKLMRVTCDRCGTTAEVKNIDDAEDDRGWLMGRPPSLLGWYSERDLCGACCREVATATVRLRKAWLVVIDPLGMRSVSDNTRAVVELLLNGAPHGPGEGAEVVEAVNRRASE